MSQNDPFEFQYFISEKNGFVVASLVGLLDPKSLERFELLSAEVLKSEFKKLVINFRDVAGISPEVIPVFAKLQKGARDRQAELRICGLKPEVKERLHRAGVIRPHELTDNLQTALQSMIASMKRAG